MLPEEEERRKNRCDTIPVEGDREASIFLNTLDLHHLYQHVKEPTHVSNHTLDLLITQKNSNLITNTCNVDCHLTTVTLRLLSCARGLVNITRPGSSVKRVVSRSIRKIKPADFCNDVKSSMDVLTESTDLNALASGFHDSLALTGRSIILRPHAPWYTDSLRSEKQRRRRLERKWQKSGLTVDKQTYRIV